MSPTLVRDRLSDWRWVAGPIACLAIAYALLLGDELRFLDERDYLAYASHLVGGRGYSLDGVLPDAYRPPGFALWLTPWTLLSDSVVLLRLVQLFTLLAALKVLAPYVVIGATTTLSARATHSGNQPGTAWCWLLLASLCYPVLYYTAGTFFPQTLLGLVLATILRLCCGEQDRETPSTGRVAIAGLLVGFALEVSPTVLSIVPAVAVALWLDRPPARAMRHVIVLLLCGALLPGAWLMRNLIVLDAPILFSRNLAENLDNAVLEIDPLAPSETRAPDDAVGYARERLEQLFGRPDEYAERVVDYFAYRNRMYVQSERSPAKDAVMFASYYGLLALVGWRLALALGGRSGTAPGEPSAEATGRWPPRTRLSRFETSVIVLYGITALFHALVFVRIRYRIPFDLLLLVPAVNAVMLTLDRRARRAHAR